MAHTPHLYLPPPWDTESVAVSDQQAHHLSRVLRIADGAPVSYTDGAGQLGSGRLEDGRVVRGEEQVRTRPCPLTVAVAPPRQKDRARFLVEKLGEIGIERLLWVRTRHSEGRPPPLAKARTWAQGALEQSRGAWLMDLVEGDLGDVQGPGLAVADLDGGDEAPTGTHTLLIGPEGGLAPDEIPEDAAKISLGLTVLRVETAAVVGAALVCSGVRGRSRRSRPQPAAEG